MARKDAQQQDVPEKNPKQGGSYIRHPETGEMYPNADDHMMAHRIEHGEFANPATTNGGEQ